ncbi:caspase-8 [Silurus asotus]|uniref:Caspase-8 n=1 Tax=Silurus asotus TaxID=30991 RepID=A0AAD5ACT4_SILAS|nr:caspase-8 [Silurus asotus]
MDLNKLHKIDEDLTQSEVAGLKFLCTDQIGRKRLENVKDAKDLFLRFSEQDLLKNDLFLPDLLCTIGRFDLLSILDTNKENVKTSLQNRCSGVSDYRKMLYSLSEDVTEENLKNMKFLLSNLPKSKMSSATFLDVLAEMEKMEMLGEDKLDKLEDVLSKCSKELVGEVQKFKNKKQRTLSTGQVESMPVQPVESLPVQPVEFLPVQPVESLPVQPVESLPVQEQSMSVQDEESRSPLTREPSMDSDTTGPAPTNEDDYYPMTRRPLGHCVIINNFNFERTSDLSNRRGTDVDRDKLTEVFTRMHFIVKEKRDQKSSDMLEVVKNFSSMDHSRMDAFVCCILSHGQKGTVLGVDGVPVQIREITQQFAQCPTLMGKPKLFFIQACQGNNLQKGVLRPDGPEEDGVESDAEKDNLLDLPIEADFLIGMATVESYKSFRHTTSGSIYIQELCKQLISGCKSKEDIHAILTKVNRKVSEKELKKHKQMPEPRYTLLKKLVLPID